LPARFGSLTLDMNAMFYKTILNSNIDWTGTDLINYTAYKSDMFYDTTWNNHFIYVQNEGSKTFLITDSSISDNSRVKVKE
jgi:hypothetical protein